MISSKILLTPINLNNNLEYLTLNNINNSRNVNEEESEKTYNKKKFLPPIKLNKKIQIRNESSPVKENIISKWHNRNLELVKRMSQKVERDRAKKYYDLHKHKKTSMERLDLIKQSFNIECQLSLQKKKEETLNKEDEKIKKNNNIYTYYIFRDGNSSESIEQCLEKRIQWKLYEKNISYCDYFEYPNLLWSHYSRNIDFSQFSKHRPTNMKEMTNHFEKHRELSNKLLLFENLMAYCENKNKDLLSFVSNFSNSI